MNICSNMHYKKPMNIIELFEEGSKKGLKDSDVFEHPDNPQRLCMDELQKRIYSLPYRDNHFRGGAYSGE
jgi:hypothetical protein